MAWPQRKRIKFEFQPDDVAVKILVSPKAASKVIGRGGETVRELRSQFSVRLHIDDQVFPGTDKQICILTGKRENVDQAFGTICTKIAEEHDTMHNGETAPAEQSMTIMLVMSSQTISKVIGTGGATIKELRASSGCNISAEKNPINGEQLVRVIGPYSQQPTAFTLLTPFIEEAGDSQALATNDYTGISGFDPKGKGKGYDKGGYEKGYDKGGYDKGYGKGQEKGYDKGYDKGYGKGHDSKGAGKDKGHAPKGGGTGLIFVKPPAATRPALSVAPGSLSARPRPIAVEPAAKYARHAEPEPTWDAGAGAEAWGAGAPDEDPAVLQSPATICFTIPSAAVSRVLGKGGEGVKGINKATSSKVSIDTGGDEGVVTLTGTVQSVHRAHAMVLGRVLSEY